MIIDRYIWKGGWRGEEKYDRGFWEGLFVYGVVRWRRFFFDVEMVLLIGCVFVYEGSTLSTSTRDVYLLDKREDSILLPMKNCGNTYTQHKLYLDNNHLQSTHHPNTSSIDPPKTHWGL